MIAIRLTGGAVSLRPGQYLRFWSLTLRDGGGGYPNLTCVLKKTILFIFTRFNVLPIFYYLLLMLILC
jgi:hypothetical protein